jgi:hypothetical protein
MCADTRSATPGSFRRTFPREPTDNRRGDEPCSSAGDSCFYNCVGLHAARRWVACVARSASSPPACTPTASWPRATAAGRHRSGARGTGPSVRPHRRGHLSHLPALPDRRCENDHGSTPSERESTPKRVFRGITASYESTKARKRQFAGLSVSAVSVSGIIIRVSASRRRVAHDHAASTHYAFTTRTLALSRESTQSARRAPAPE